MTGLRGHRAFRVYAHPSAVVIAGFAMALRTVPCSLQGIPLITAVSEKALRLHRIDTETWMLRLRGA
jgi:hypothetical protein